MGRVSPTPPDEPAKRRRTRSAEPDGQGTWLDLGPARRGPDRRRRRGGDAAGGGRRTATSDRPSRRPRSPSGSATRPEEPDARRRRARARAGGRRGGDRGPSRGPRRRDRLPPEPRAGPRRHDDRGPAADPRRRRVGQDARRRAPDRVPRSASRRSSRTGSSRSRSPTGRPASCGSGSRTSSATSARTSRPGTFHALCARVLRRDGEAIGLDRRFVIYDTDDQQQLMKRILAEEDLPATGEFRPAAILGAISRAKNEMLDETFLAENAVNHRERVIARLADALPGAAARRQRARLRRPPARGRASCSRRRPTCSRSTRQRWRYLHVDEYQDTNRPQYLWVRALAAAPPQPVRRGRRRPVDLRLARRERPEHPRLRARLPGRDGRQARAELPLDAADPRRGARGRLAQRAADRQEAVDREPGRRPDPALRGVQRGRGGRVDRPPGRGAGRVERPGLVAHAPGGRRRVDPVPARRTSRSCTG